MNGVNINIDCEFIRTKYWNEIQYPFNQKIKLSELNWICNKFNWFQSGSIFAAGEWRAVFGRLERDQVVVIVTWNGTSGKTSWHHRTSRQLKFAINWVLLPCGFRGGQILVMQPPNFPYPTISPFLVHIVDVILYLLSLLSTFVVHLLNFFPLDMVQIIQFQLC